MAGARVSVVIVAWECGEELLRCVRSLASARSRVGADGPAIELVVVDNASHDLAEAELRAEWPDLCLLRNSANRGFGPACNQGAAQARGDILLYLNPDTVAVDDPFSPIVDAFASSPAVVAAAPRLIDTDAGAGESQESFQLRHLPTLGQAARELLLFDKAFPRNRWLRRDRYLDADRRQPFEVEQPAAAALAVRRDVFLALGGFDESFVPAWFEDVDVCTRLRSAGRIVFWPASSFVHAGGISARHLGYDAFLPIYYANARRYWRKHHGRVAALLYRLLLVKGMGLRLALLPLRRIVPRPRREAARAYARVLREALVP